MTCIQRISRSLPLFGKWSSILLVLLFSFIGNDASAEFYKYRDANGVLRFTDNLAEVPPEQRPKVESYRQVEDFQQPSEPEPESTDSRDESEEISRGRTEGEGKPSSGEVADKYKALNERKAELDAEYQELVAAQEALAEERKTADTPQEQQAVNEKVMALNERISAFEQKRSAFEEEVQAFNAQN